MAVHVFSGNKIAVIWDFDQTLIPGYQQQPIFQHYGVDSKTFWREVNALPQYYQQQQSIQVSSDTAYLCHMLTYVKTGQMKGLSNAKLREFGSGLTFYPGMPDFLPIAKNHIEENGKYQCHDIKVEHYIVSTGLRQMILGSGVAPHVDGVWACEFIEAPAPAGFDSGSAVFPAGESTEISQVGYFLDNTTKTRAIWEINKGTNKDSNVGVNDHIAQQDRRVPLRNMIYIADGPSDIPVFSVLNQYGGKTLGVHNKDQQKHFRQVKQLRDQGRVQHFAPADYTSGASAAEWILASLEDIAEDIVRDRTRLLTDTVGKPPHHVT